MRHIKNRKETNLADIEARVPGPNQIACSLRAVGIGMGLGRSAYGLCLPELKISTCGLVRGNPIFAEFVALEFGLRVASENRKTQVIIESASSWVIESLRGSFHGEPQIARDVRNLLNTFERVHLYLVGFDDLEDVRGHCQNVVQSLAISHL